MIIKAFQKNKNGKIELSIKEIEQLLTEAYWDGYNNKKIYFYQTPSWWSTAPYYTPQTTNICTNEWLKTDNITITCCNSRKDTIV